MEKTELLIIGAGAAGISAACAAWDAGCRDVVLTDRSRNLGGILPQCLHAGFGLSAGGTELTGPAYAERLAQRQARTGVRFLPGREVLAITKEKTAVVSGGGGLEPIRFEKLILATGCRERTIGTLPIAGTRPAGIFTAGQAQEMINLHHWMPGSRIVILGSGDLGMILARRFTLEGKQVLAVVEQGESYGGMTRNFHRCIEAFQIPIRYRRTIREIHGMPRITGVTIETLDSGEREFLSCDTLVTAIGLIPERELVRGLGEPEWLSYAGNCHRVHDIADSAAAEGE
ncbi:MAG: FAD-dependent oxidoreductase, partial [Oscillospiraceae bacterium]|nr:FAD-dependent oxidoreductase [Oscillospiraceae bacterium]